MAPAADHDRRGDQVRRLLDLVAAGDAQAAEALLPLVYEELHELAGGDVNDLVQAVLSWGPCASD